MTEEQSRRAQRELAAATARPVVTISREAGSNGTLLGRLVAERLGFRLWDQELVQRIAEQSHASEALLAAVDERARGVIEELLSASLTKDSGTEAEYLRSLLRVIHVVAQGGGAVIVGRGAQFALDAAKVLRVRVVGPIESRTRQLATTRQLPEREARAEVDRIDGERHAFVRHHFRSNSGNPSAYNLVVNTSGIPPARAVDVVVAAYRAKFPGQPIAGP